jgi:5,10-methylenetetrahydrofolate reductase
VSSVAVAHEVERMGGRAIACVNARDRNLLGFRRDLLTAAAYGVDQFLLVYGDAPTSGQRTGQLTVRSMLAEVRTFAASTERSFRAGVSSRLAPLPAWKQEADQLFVQVSFSLGALLQWRETVQFDGPVYAGVMVLASAGMARKLAHDIPEIAVPRDQLDALDRSRDAGVDLACEHVLAVRDSGAFDGVHLVPVSRYREVAARLERDLRP